jgi:ABC-type branched-subunit amino acid transport system ATPase component
MMLVGDTGAGKTTLLATLAAWVWKNYGKVSLYYSFDPGGWGDQMQALIDRGIVWVVQPKGIDPQGDLGLALGAASLCAKGYW